MNGLSEIRLANKFKAVKRTQDLARALNRGTDGRLAAPVAKSTKAKRP